MAITGTIGDGITDDTIALQSWLDAGSTEVPDGTETYLVSAELNVDQAGNQTADFNGTTITANSVLLNLFNVDKPSGEFTLNNLTIDGNDVIAEAILVESLMQGNNVTINNLYRVDGNAVGIRINHRNDPTQFGHSIFTDFNFDNIRSEQNNIIGTFIGSARAVIVDKFYNRSNSRISFVNGTWGNVWGDDGDIVQINDKDQPNDDTVLVEFINIDFGNMNRRHAKVTSGWVHFVSCTFTCPSSSLLDVQATTGCCGTTAGREGDFSAAEGFNHKYINCTFIGTGTTPQLRRMYVVKTGDLEVNGCTFIDYDIVFEDQNTSSTESSVYGVEIINCVFDSNSFVSGFNLTGTGTSIGFGNNTGLQNNLPSGTFSTISNPDPIHTCSDGLLSPGEFTTDNGGVCDIVFETPEDYGYNPSNSQAVNDLALQTMFDNAQRIRFGAGQIYNIGVKLDIDTVNNQIIDGNNAIIVSVSSSANIMLFIDKRGSASPKTTIYDLEINGGGVSYIGTQIYSCVDFDNVTVRNFYHPTNIVAGIWCEIYNDPAVYGHGNWTFDNCVVDDITTVGDNDPFNSIGSADNFLAFHRESISAINSFDIIVKDTQLSNAFGSEGQNIGVFSPSLDVSNGGARIIFDNVTCFGWQRRSVKGFCGNVIYRNSNFTETDTNNPNLVPISGYGPAGFFVVAESSGATGASNIFIENCNFNGNGGAEYSNKVVVITTSGVTMSNNTFTNGTDFEIGGVLSNLTVCNNNMTNGGVVRENTDQPPQTDGGGIIFDTRNTYSEFPPFTNITNYNITEQLLNCPLDFVNNETPISNLIIYI